MIRSCTLIEFKPDTPLEHIEEISQAVRELRTPGMRDVEVGPDIGLKEGNMSYAVVADFDDADAYRTWDTHPEHERIRRELTRPAFVRYERVQFHLSD
jgi:heme-degrading monooxygenase HmoA